MNTVDSSNPYRTQNIAIPSILVGIIVISIISSVLLYSIQARQYAQLNDDLEQQLQDSISAKSFHISQVTALHLSSIMQATQILASTIAIQNNHDAMIKLLESAADSSDEIQSFFVFDRDAVLLYTTSTSKSSIGAAFSNHTSFVGAKSGSTFVSNLTLSLDGTYRIFVSSPIIDPASGEFNGVIGASLLSDTLAASIKNEVTFNPSDALTLVDPAGNIITASSSGNSTVGKNVLSEEVLGSLPPSIRQSLTRSLVEAIQGNSGVYTINLRENPELNNTDTGVDFAMIAYSPVILDGKISMISFVVESTNIQDLISQGENLASSSSFVFVYLVLAVMAVFAAVIIMINRKLIKKIIRATTALSESNFGLKKLANELEEKTARLQEADTAKEEFSAMITHELKTPLVPVIGYAELLLDGTLGDLTPKQKQKIKIMHQNATSLSRLISDLLDVRKLELGQMKFDMIAISPQDIIEQSIESVRPLANGKGVTLIFDESHNNDLLPIKADPKRIQQVFNNLLTNAIKFVPEQTGKVEVSLRKSDDGYVTFAVKDNGIGIPPDKQQNLFKKFYQVDTSLRRATGGSGLGLAISKGIVEAHGGKMWFESESEAGSVFYFSIPHVSGSKMEISNEGVRSA